ncbi:MAG: type II CRISPR RNA-guided endonuclease Cas9 [Nitrospinae bacterium]|nr:type II CRISPR RNA-guided endonuclease Cas9 [Nitrospinota bacterium]
MNNFILGLDMGTNSIGWAIVKCDGNKKPVGIIDLNARIFQEMIEADIRVPKNKKRREKRGARRLTSRYKERREKLVQLLIQNGLLPESMKDMKGWEKFFNGIGDPFKLRADGADKPLTLYQFGRVLMHLLRRRGYRSNRGAKYIDLMKHPEVIKLSKQEEQDNDEVDGEDKEKIDERKKTLAGIRQLHTTIKEGNCKTLGEFIYKTSLEHKHEPRRITKLKINDITLYADRKMYEDEFNILWDKQKGFLPLTDGFKVQVRDAIFNQRSLKIQKNLVGKCNFEPNRKRAARALLEAQEFRMLQEINDLNVKLPYAPFIPLTQEQRQKLLDALNNPDNLNEKGQLTWAEIKRAIELDKKAKFNLQETSKNGISGNRTDIAFYKIIPNHWNKFSLEQKQALITDILTIHDKRALFSRLINEHNRENNPWRFSREDAYALATLELEAGYVKHCLKVINKLLPFMREGMNYHDACQKAGYLRKDQITVKQQASLPSPPNVANPIVQKALFETRRVVNSIFKIYGRPQIIRIELARDLKSSKDHRKKIQEQQRENQRLNENAEREILEWAKQHPEYRRSPDDILKYKLWQELGEINHQCPYSGKVISQAMLFSGEVEVDHIFPLSRSHDDSFANKVLCLASENQEKGQRTPYEAWGRTDKYDDILLRLEKKFSPRKLAKIKEINFDGKGFVSAQLNDTRYISVAVKIYLEQLGIPVQVSTGQATAAVRRFLGLNNILPKKSSVSRGDTEHDDDDTQGNNEQDKKTGIKKERNDHRHHAIDALVTALTDKKLFDELTKRYQYYEMIGKKPEEKLEKICYWNNLRKDVKGALTKSVVSHATNRKISGGLHKEMPFGASYYLEEVEVKKLKPYIIHTNPKLPDAETWIFKEKERELVQSWWEASRKDGKSGKNTLPILSNGSPLEKVKIAHRCYVKRKPLKDALSYIANDTGKKTWIIDEAVRNILSEWLNVPGNNPKKAEENPPVVPNKKNPKKSPHPIKTVRVATTFSPSSIRRIGKGQNQFFELGSNHHVVIFKHKETGERKGRIVSMMEAASRVRKSPIIKTEYPEFNPLEWEFEMFLCSHDMVQWDTDDPEWQEKGHQLLGLPIYRVQKMSQTDSGISIVFRHHSVTATKDTDNYGVIRKTPNTIRCKKIMIDALGRYIIEK